MDGWMMVSSLLTDEAQTEPVSTFYLPSELLRHLDPSFGPSVLDTTFASFELHLDWDLV